MTQPITTNLDSLRNDQVKPSTKRNEILEQTIKHDYQNLLREHDGTYYVVPIVVN